MSSCKTEKYSVAILAPEVEPVVQRIGLEIVFVYGGCLGLVDSQFYVNYLT